MVIGVDTNILYWLGYSYASKDASVLGMLRPYSAFIARAAKAGSKFACTGLSLVEGIHRIESDEFHRLHPRAKHKELKKFRSDPVNRACVSAEIEAFWATAKSMAGVLQSAIDYSAIDRMLENQIHGEIDAYDMAIIEACSSSGVKAIITGDADLITYESDVLVLTADGRALAEAAKQGRLVAMPAKGAS